MYVYHFVLVSIITAPTLERYHSASDTTTAADKFYGDTSGGASAGTPGTSVWTECWDPNENCNYYYHTITGET